MAVPLSTYLFNSPCPFTFKLMTKSSLFSFSQTGTCIYSASPLSGSCSLNQRYISSIGMMSGWSACLGVKIQSRSIAHPLIQNLLNLIFIAWNELQNDILTLERGTLALLAYVCFSALIKDVELIRFSMSMFSNSAMKSGPEICLLNSFKLDTMLIRLFMNLVLLSGPSQMLNHESGVSPRYSCSYALIFVLSMLADPFECATNELTVSLTNLTNLYILSTSILTQLSIGTFVISALPSYFSAFFTKLDQNSKIVLAISVLFKLDSILDCMDFI